MSYHEASVDSMHSDDSPHGALIEQLKEAARARDDASLVAQLKELRVSVREGLARSGAEAFFGEASALSLFLLRHASVSRHAELCDQALRLVLAFAKDPRCAPQLDVGPLVVALSQLLAACEEKRCAVIALWLVSQQELRGEQMTAGSAAEQLIAAIVRVPARFPGSTSVLTEVFEALAKLAQQTPVAVRSSTRVWVPLVLGELLFNADAKIRENADSVLQAADRHAGEQDASLARSVLQLLDEKGFPRLKELAQSAQLAEAQLAARTAGHCVSLIFAHMLAKGAKQINLMLGSCVLLALLVGCCCT